MEPRKAFHTKSLSSVEESDLVWCAKDGAPGAQAPVRSGKTTFYLIWRHQSHGWLWWRFGIICGSRRRL